jgi:hypothetical protein
MTRDAGPGRFSVTCGGYTVECTTNGLPSAYDHLKAHATLIEEIALHERNLCCVTVRRSGEAWPFLLVAQSCEPHDAGFDPGVLLVLETKLLLVGAGERILAFQLEPPGKRWEDHVQIGFLAWEQYGETILLSAELEFAAWNNAGEKLWTTFVEPPWSYTVKSDKVELDVMGKKKSFTLREGPRGP